MFSIYSELISTLKNTDPHFLAIFNKHEQLDKQITDLERRPAEYHGELQAMKKQKLALKDEIHQILLEHQH